MTPQPERSDPRAILRILWRWKLLFLAILVAAPVISYLVVRNKPKVYESSTLISVTSAQVSGGTAGSIGVSNVVAIARLVNTSPVASVAAKLLNPPANPAVIAGEVAASGDVATGFITITAQAHKPAEAAAVANAFARALGTNRTNAAIAQLNTQIAALQRQLAAAPPGNAQVRQPLQQQIDQLRAQRGSQGGNVAVAQPATPNSTPVSPRIRRTVELGFVIGLLIAIGAVAVAENSDRRLRSPSDLEDMTNLPLLSAIPTRAFSAPVDSTGREEEAFQMLRAALTYFNVDRRMETVAVASAGQKDGKTTVATRLALATARSGKNVILVDADLRRAQICVRLGIDAPVGLGAVLVGEAQLQDVLIDYPVQGTRGARLQVLPAGAPPPNPSELLGSAEMARLLGELETHSDLVIVDTAAALAVSDPLPLLQEASGVVLIARMNTTTRESLRRLQRVITSARGTVVGVVATATSSGPGYDEYGYGYTPNGATGLRGRNWLRRRKAPSAPSGSKPDVELKASPTELSDV